MRVVGFVAQENTHRAAARSCAAPVFLQATACEWNRPDHKILDNPAFIFLLRYSLLLRQFRNHDMEMTKISGTAALPDTATLSSRTGSFSGHDTETLTSPRVRN